MRYPDFNTKQFYIFLARLDDDPLVPLRVREHANLMRQELQSHHKVDMDQFLPKRSDAASEQIKEKP